MTVAIAAISDSDGTIVTASDTMISYDDTMPATEHGGFKVRSIAARWALMFAANDIDLFIPMVRAIREKLGSRDAIAEADTPVIKEAVVGAYRDFFVSAVTAEHLARFGFKNVADFMENGREQFGDQLFGNMADRVDTYDLGISLMAYGFDTLRSPHIFIVSNPGIVRDCDYLRYGVIGSGRAMASASMRRSSIAGEFSYVGYRVLEAKFSAETASGVGKSTFLRR